MKTERLMRTGIVPEITTNMDSGCVLKEPNSSLFIHEH